MHLLNHRPMHYRAGFLVLAVIILIFTQIGCERSEPDIVAEARRYLSGNVLVPWDWIPKQHYKSMHYYYMRSAWDNRDPQLFEYLSEEELQMFEAMLHLMEGQILLAFRQLRKMQRNGYPRAKVLQRAAVFLTKSLEEGADEEGAEAVGLEALRAERDAPEPSLTDDEIYYLFRSFPGVSGDKNFPGYTVKPASRFVSVFPHERAAGLLLESDEYMAGIEHTSVETFTVTAPGELIDFEDLVTTRFNPYLIEDAPLTEVLNRIRTGEPVSQQSIAMALAAYADPSRRDVPTLNLLLDALGDIESLIDIDEILHYSVWDNLGISRWWLLQAVIRSGYYTGRYETALDAFERLRIISGTADKRPSNLEFYLYGAACAAGLGDLERAYTLLKEYLRYATIYHVPESNVDINDFDIDFERPETWDPWHDALRAESARIQRDMDAQWDHLDIFHALVWYYLIAREFDAFIDTPYDTRIENLFASRFKLADVDFIAHDGRSGPLEKLISAYERIAAEQE